MPIQKPTFGVTPIPEEAKDAIEFARHKISLLKEEEVSLLRTIDDLKKTIAAHELHIEDMGKSVTESNEKTDAAKKQLNEVSGQLVEVSRKLEEESKSLHEIMQKEKELIEANREARQELDRIKEEIIVINQQKDQLTNEYTDLQKKIKIEVDQLEEKKRKVIEALNLAL